MSKNLMFHSIFLLAIIFSLLNAGCSSLQGFLGGDSGAKSQEPTKQQFTKFSDNPNVLNTANRNYKRMNRQKMEEESDLGSQAGSMWVGEGQGAYLFTQNKSRKEGDLLNVKIDGSAQKQIETKVSVIKKLLKQLEEEELKANQAQTQTLADNSANPKKPDGERAPAAEKKEDKKEEKEEPLDIGAVPTRIVERMADGNYRVKGAQPFMIGKREYKVIVTGLIRPEDFNDEGVSSGKILDPQYDVVSIRRSQQ